MKAVEGTLGRVFVVRLEDGDRLPDCLEAFASEQGIKVASVTLVGGVAGGSIVTGPRDGAAVPPDPVVTPLEGVHEVLAAGVIAPGPDGSPGLHLHGALGRCNRALAGCLRPGVDTWLVGEAIICEIGGVDSRRVTDPQSGFALLEP